MCGGIGSRFWPVSRGGKPKQFLDFFGTGRSLLRMTVDRILPVVEMKNIILVTNCAYASLIREQLPDIPEENILYEPARRNTAPCICWAAHHVIARDPDASMVVLASDHLILKEDSFRNDILRGIEYVEETGNLLTLGVTPSSPHTGYGYIQATTACVDRPGILKVKSFTEKPDLHMAEMFVSSGEFYWNAGMFLWRADSILKAFERYAPEIAAVFNAGNDVYGTPEETAFIDEEFPNAPCISIDYAIMEKASNVYVMTVDFGWSDLGSWKALYEVSPRNRDGNVTQQSRVMAYDCSGCVFHSDPDKVIVAAGLENYIVTQSGNATLIYPLEREQQIRRVVNELGEAFGDRYL